ncbi:MAG TPA: autotransporter assembly complex family protein [Pseudomonadales bacterium]
MLALARMPLIGLLLAAFTPSIHAADDDSLPTEPLVVITGAGPELENNIRAFLSVTSEACSTGQARLRRLLPQVRRQLAEAASALGYYHAEGDPRFSQGEGCWRLDIDVQPGPRVMLGSVDVSVIGGPDVQQQFADLLEASPLASGRPLHHGDYESFKSALSARAIDEGYFGATFADAQIALDLDANRADVALRFDPGPRYRFGRITVRSDSRLNSDVIDGMMPVQEGDPYSSDALADVRASLDASQYFRQIRVSPQIGSAAQQQVPVDVELEMRPRHAWTTGLGFTTDTGPRARLSYDNRYVNARGHRLNVDSSVSQVRSQLDGNYLIPLADASRQSLNFAGGYSVEDNESFESKRTKLEASVRNQNRAGWLQTVFIDTQHDDYIVAGQQDTSVLSTLGASLSRTKADNLINPNQGWKLYTQLRGASDDVLSDATFVQWYGSAKHVLGFGRSRLLSRIEVGATWIDLQDELPASLRYFAGGDQSIRGFAFRELGPVNAANEVIGGKQLIVGSVEYDFQVRENWRVAVFADTGNAFNDRDDLEWRHSAGFGVRWMSPIGPVRVDIAHPIDGTDAFRLHVTMGPDL